VEIVSLPWGQAFETLATMVAGGDIPDVVEMPDAGSLSTPRLANWQPRSLCRRMGAWRHLNRADRAHGQHDGGPELEQLPYGFYLRAMFYNKDLLEQAGVAEPPRTMEEFVAGRRRGERARGQVRLLPARRPRRHQRLDDVRRRHERQPRVLHGGRSVPRQRAGLRPGPPDADRPLPVGLRPADSINWGFNEIVAGFYSGTCAFLDQDPDALIGISDQMDPESFAVMPMPVGPGGRAFPTIGYAGWSIFNTTEHPDEAWSLDAHLSAPESNSVWAQRVGVIPIHQGADQDPYFRTEQFAGWFEELNNPDTYIPLSMPSYLEGFGFFADQLSIETSQQALLGEITAQEMADQWAEY
jgi:multiple sugar transport system substrate-binding protein